MNRHSQHFLGLDGLRGIAASIVVFLHGTLFIENFGYIPPAACLAVDFFFLLSGFVVAHAYDHRLISGMTWRQFMAVRMVRLYPMLFVGIVMGTITFSLGRIQKHDLDMATTIIISFGSFILFPAGLFANTLAYPVNIVTWSLFFEIAASVLYGSRFGKLNNARLCVFVAVSGAAIIPMSIWGGPHIEIGFGSLVQFLLGFVRVTYPFWAGVMMFRVLRVRATPRVPMTLVGLALALLLLAPVDQPAYDLLLVLIVFPVIVALGARATVGHRMAYACSFLGRLSYPLYLVHVPVFQVINKASQIMHLGISPWALVIAGSVVSVIVAEVLLVTFDEPVRAWLSSQVRARGGRNPQAAVQRG